MLAFAPGECAQVDWGSYGTVRVGDTTRRLSFFVMVLCYSRQLYVEFTVSQTMEHFLTCHQNAFAAFGGVPTRIMIDNLRSGVLKHAVGEAPVFNPRYLDFSRHHGFCVSADSMPSSTNRFFKCSIVRQVTPTASATATTVRVIFSSEVSHNNSALAWVNF
jgi:transposase